MKKYVFKTDEYGEEFCDNIILEMIRLFGISENEALDKINKHWKDSKLVGEKNIIYHEDEEFWAKRIYYGPDVMWWKTGEE